MAHKCIYIYMITRRDHVYKSRVGLCPYTQSIFKTRTVLTPVHATFS